VAASGALWLTTLNGLAGILGLGLNWWLNRRLPDAPVQMGLWSVVLSMLLMTSLAFEGGVGAALQQRKDLVAGAITALAWLQILLGIGGSLLLHAFADPLARLLSGHEGASDLPGLVRLVSPAVAIIAAGLPPKALLQRDLKFRKVGGIEAGATLSFVACALVLTPRMGLRGVILSTLFRYSAETAAYWGLGTLRPWHLFRLPDWRASGEMLHYGVGLALQGLFGTVVRQGDVLLVGALAGTVTAGIYRQIQTLVVQPYAKFGSYVARATFPAFARAQAEPERLRRGIARMQRLLSLCIVPALLGMAAVAPRLLAEYLGPQFAAHLGEASAALGLSCLAAIAFMLSQSVGVAMNAAGHSHPMLWRQIVAGFATLGFIAAGQPFGLVGISVGRVVAGVIALYLVLDLAKRKVSLSWRDVVLGMRESVPAGLACALVAILVGVAFGWLWPSTLPYQHATAMRATLLAQVAAGGLAYAATLLLLGVRPLREWRDLRR
jgi:PST family polysaccharide transporter